MANIIRKVFPFEVKEVSNRILEFTGSTEEIDREGEVVLVSGWDLRHYKANPVFMWAHRYDQPPIGKANRVWASKEGKLKFHIEFAPKETYEFADTIYQLYKGGFLKATSVGFVPLEWEDGDGIKSPKRTYSKQELLELSAVPVPSNPAALISTEDAQRIGIDMGILTKAFEDIEKGIVQKPEETENYIRIPVRGEEGKHDGHRIRTITLDEGKGIKALYCGECKKITTYLFSKDEGWTMESAQAWIREHSKEIQYGEAKESTSPGDSSKGQKEETIKGAISQGQIKDELDYVKSLIVEGNLDADSIALAWDVVRELMQLPGSNIPVDIVEQIRAKTQLPQHFGSDTTPINDLQLPQMAVLVVQEVQKHIDRLCGAVN